RRSTSSRSRSRRARRCPARWSCPAPRRPPSRRSSAPTCPRGSRSPARTRRGPCRPRALALSSTRGPLVPLERPLPPDVDVGDREDHQEEEELHEAEPGELVEDHRERVEEDNLDVEDDEEHRREVEADREAFLVGRPL